MLFKSVCMCAFYASVCYQVIDGIITMEIAHNKCD